MSDDYEDLLNRTRAETPTLETLPVGSYRLKSRVWSYLPAKEADKNDCVMCVYNAMEALDDVDPDALAALGDYDITQNKLFFRVWIESETDWGAFWSHVDKHGELGLGPDASRKEAMEKVKGAEIIAWLDQRSFVNKAGDMVDTNDPTSFAAVAD